MEITLSHYLSVSAILFVFGVFGIFINRKNVITILMHGQSDAAEQLQASLVQHGETSELLEFYNQRLRRAAAEGDVAELHALLTCGAEIDCADEEGLTALHLAAEFGRHEAVQLLVELGADLEACDDTGQTPLVRAHAPAYCHVWSMI